MPTNQQIRIDINKSILEAAPGMPEKKTLMAQLALEFGWRSETITDILGDLIAAKRVEVKNGLIVEPSPQKPSA